MSTKEEGGALIPETGGAGAENQDQVKVDPPSKDSVSYESYQKAVTEAKKAKDERDRLRQELKEKQEKELKETNNYKELLKLREADLEKERKDRAELQSVIESGSKMQAFLAEVQGDLPRQFWGLVDLEKIVINPETKMPDKQAVASYAREFEKQFGKVLDNPNSPQLPSDAPKGNGQLTYEAWLALPLKEKKERYKDVIKTI